MSRQIVSFSQRPDLRDKIRPFNGSAVWPVFMLYDPMGEYFDHLYTVFPDYQFMMIDGDEVLAVGNSLPFHFDQPLVALPDEGWDWVIEKGFADHKVGIAPNLQSALSIGIRKDLKGAGLSGEMVRGMKQIGISKGHEALVAPVRPNWKARYPLTPMERYITWQTSDGLPFDPWLRVHARVGARILKTCPLSMIITGSVSDWEEWTEMRFPESGQYIVPEALNPVEIDCDKNEGRYVEPNVWIVHPIDGKSAS